jgi:hypothetical protein
MDGIDYIVDEKGKKKAVIIDLETFGSAYEDIEDILVAYSRINEPRIPLEKVKTNLISKGRL